MITASLPKTPPLPSKTWEWGFRSVKTAVYLLAFMGLFTLLSCSRIPPLSERQQTFAGLIQTQHWQQQLIKGDVFDLIAVTPQQQQPHSQLVIYLEGDGLAWVNRTQISSDPTPINPIALQLALAHQGKNAAYLARPCQYVMDKSAATENAVVNSSSPNCTPNAWTNGRFSEAATQATNTAITRLKQQAQAQTLVLVGYSGGAALALLVAARRDDVQHIITVAGNLDHQAWTQLHKITPLTDSLNPTNYRPALQAIPQTHFVGEDDKNTPPQLAEEFLNRFSERTNKDLRIIRNFDHQCCWVKEWVRLYPK